MGTFVRAFALRLNTRIEPRLVAVGRFDGVHDSLAVGTRGGRVVVHSPHARSSTATGALPSAVEGIDGPSRPIADELSFLNFNCELTALAAGRLGSDRRDLLFVGSPAHLQAHAVADNADVFYKDVPDGVNALAVGPAGSCEDPLVFAGGNCSIQGFDADGNDRFWTVTGDNVSALALCDVDGDGRSELLVGSDDFDIRTYRDDEVIAEMAESDRVVALCRLFGGHYAFGTAGGTVGVYGPGGTRLWRTREQAVPVGLCAYDIDPDGSPEVVVGWSNGVVEIRSERTGDVVFRDELGSPVAGVARADYRRSGRREIVVCSVDGEVRGYMPASEKRRSLPPPPPGRPVAIAQPTKEAAEERQIAELIAQKEALARELTTLRAAGGAHGAEGEGPAAVAVDGDHAAIPEDAHVSVSFDAVPGDDRDAAHVLMSVSANGGALVRAVVVFADRAFPGGAFVAHSQPSGAGESLLAPLRFARDAPDELDIRVIVGTKSGRHCRVFDLVERLPKFALFASCAARTRDGAHASSHAQASSTAAAGSVAALGRSGSSGVLVGSGAGSFAQDGRPALGRGGSSSALGGGALALARVPEGQTPKEPQSYVVLKISERPSKVAAFVARNFMGGETLELADGQPLAVSLVHLRDNEPISFAMPAGGGELTLRTDNMDLAGDIIQALVADLGIDDAPSVAEFPAEMDRLRELLAAVDEHNAFRQRLFTGVADVSNLVRALLLRAEDARCIGKTETMKGAYAQLHRVNADLLAEHAKRLTNRNDLLDALRDVNKSIQRAARLRAGKPQAQMVAACRAALKQNSTAALLKIMRTGQ